MLRRLSVTAAVMIGLCVMGTGCLSAQGVKSFLAGIANDSQDPTDREDGNWQTAGKEGRGHMLREQDPDKYWGDWFMSPKAKEIENNLGIDH